MGRRDTDESIYRKIAGLTTVLEERKSTLSQMIIDQIKYQHMQGTKDDIYRLHREIAELRNELSTSWSMAKQRRPQAPKQRNFIAKSVRDPEGPFRPRVIKNKIKNKKPKYPIDLTKKVDILDY